MSAPAVLVENLFKEYRIGGASKGHGTLYEQLGQALKAPFRRGAGKSVPEGRNFWALQDVNFQLAPGEVVGIIGRNGAGKSTLLKVLSRITAPTRGRVQFRGRLASLLEVGTGFHPELTGRENVFLNGSILGMKRSEIALQFDEIVAFAEVGGFIDTPVKHYSSGMYVRLAFAVAAHLNPEILIVDEVLAVGDARFQKRCLGKMQDVASQGRTVLFVSHNMLAVQRLCSRVIWLDAGRAKADGPAHDVVAQYIRDGVEDARDRRWASTDTAPGNAEVAIARLAVEPLRPGETDAITVATGAKLTFEYWNKVPGAALNLSLHVHSSDDTLVLNAVPLTDREWLGKPFPVGRFRSVCELPPHLLNADTYRVDLLVVRDQNHIIYRDEAALSFEVEEPQVDSAWHGKTPGVVRPILTWNTKLLGTPASTDRATTLERLET